MLWNASNGFPVFDAYCGGGHRAWQIRKSTDPTILHFDFIRGSELCRQRVPLSSKDYVVTTPHSSPIVATAGSQNYLVTVSLDGNLSIANNQAKPILIMFVGENLLCSDVYENGADVYVVTGGGKSKLSVWKFQKETLENQTFWLRHVSRPDEGRIVCTKVARINGNIYFIASYSSGTIEVLRKTKDSLQSVFVTELEDVLGIGSKIGIYDDKSYETKNVYVGTSGSYLITFNLSESGELAETCRVVSFSITPSVKLLFLQRLTDRSGVTAIAVGKDQNPIVGCDSGHVFNVETSGNVSKVHSHLSTVVGIVADGANVHSVSLDCALLTTTGSTISRKPTIVDMPGGMVKTGDSSLVVVGNGIQVVKLL